jgi:hypothetical protein
VLKVYLIAVLGEPISSLGNLLLRPDEFVAEAVSSTKNTKLEKTVKKLFKERTSE